MFPWIVEHATHILNECHVESDGNSTYERLQRRQHREVLLPVGTALMFRVAGKVPGCVMTERWHLGTWLGKRFHREEHIAARKGDGLVVRSKAVKAMPDETTDVPRRILSRDEPPLVPVEERPVPRNMKISKEILKKWIHAKVCKMQETVAQRMLPSRLGTFSGLSCQDRGSKQDRSCAS